MTALLTEYVGGRLQARAGSANAQFGYGLPSGGPRAANGVWAEWAFDEQRVEVRSDRYGLRPLFYFSTGTRFGVGDSIPELLRLGAPRELDYPALAVFLRLGFFLGDATPFRCIRAVPPSAHLVFDGRLTVNTSRSMGVPSGVTREQAIDRYIELFRLAISQCAPDGPFVHHLSGGRDSRHLLLELVRQGHRPKVCLSTRRYPVAVDTEWTTAAQLCSRLGLAHETVDPPKSRFGAEFWWLKYAGYCTDEGAWFLGLREYHERNGTERLYDGLAGDVLSAGWYQSEEFRRCYDEGRLDDLAEGLIGPRGTGAEWFFPPNTRKLLGWEVARSGVVEELRKFQHAPNPVQMFVFWNRTCREISLAPFRAFDCVPRCYVPYLNPELFDFLAGLPPEFTLNKSLHTEAIARAYPEFADIPYGGSRSSSSAWLRMYSKLILQTTGRGIRSHPGWLASHASYIPRWIGSLADGSHRKHRQWLNPKNAIYYLALSEGLQDEPAQA